nr:hypothetical protein [Tanacetum cinerariifolium]
MDYEQSGVDHNNSEEKIKLINQLIKECDKKTAKYQNRLKKANQQSKDFKNQNKVLQEKCDVLQNQATSFEEKNNELNEQFKMSIEKNDDLLAQMNVLQEQLEVKHVVIDTHVECQAKYAKLEAERYEYMIRYSAYFDNDKQHRKWIANQEILFDKMNFDKIDSPFQQTSSLKPYVLTVILEKIIIDLEDGVVSLLAKEKENLETIESLKSKGCSKHMAGNRALLANLVEKFLRMVRFGNNDFAVIAGYEDVVIGSMTIKKVYYVEGLYFLTGDRSSNLDTIALNEFASNSLSCLLAKASSLQYWLWHQRLSHLNFATINNLVKNNLFRGLCKMKFEKDHLSSAYEQRKIHRKHHKYKMAFLLNQPLYLLHMDLCGPMRVENINGKRYVLVVVDDFSRISQQFSPVRTPQQNGVVERRNWESSSSSLNDDVQQSPEEVILPQTNTQSILNDMIPNVDEASSSHNVFNERLEDAYFDASTTFHDISDVHTYYQPYPHETK